MRKRLAQHGGAATVLLTIGSTLIGCATADHQIQYENFSRIQPHVTTRAEVVSLLGEPDHRMGDDWWMYRRPEEHLHAIVEFDENGHVSRKQWIDAEGNEVWEDSTDRTP